MFGVFTLLYTVDGAGRSFPVESENYAVQRFQRINSNIVSSFIYSSSILLIIIISKLKSIPQPAKEFMFFEFQFD